MPVIIPAGFAQVSFEFAGPAAEGSRPVVTLGVGAADIVADFLADLADFFGTNLAPVMSSSWTAKQVTYLTATTRDVAVVALPGEDDSAASPPNVAFLVRKGTALRGRKNQGRSYWPGLLFDNQVNTDGSITAGEVGAFQVLMNELMVRIGDHTSGQVILHSAEGTPTPVDRYTVEGVIATQRRRLRR